ncbi:hypothetical protein M011DRAFT_394025 [Sporormia fimetaria CBS 119925]|uniref:MPN domain-containing protein n=1 Tax=Sporormia fimetaria CBS 119925 TaxID=1340428 RepID=A0A6A6VNA6_9PLEO|nr:hypothetical protein M011DRAFT_394025 [Sporormia fimetaria CBS 119925]
MASFGAPASVADITQQAENFKYDPKIKLRHWLRSADTMQKEAQIYEAEGNDAQTYLLLYRHAKLLLDHLSKHPERNLPENRKALHAANAAVATDLAKLETIRPRISKRHNEYLARQRAQRQALESLEGRGSAGPAIQDDQTQLKRRSRERAIIDALQHKSLAVRLAQREVRRRDTARRKRGEDELGRRSGGVWVDWQTEVDPEQEDDLSRRLQEVARLQNGQPSTGRTSSTHSSTAYRYPTVPHKSMQPSWADYKGYDESPQGYKGAPARPPKERIRRPSDSLHQPPPLPPKPLISTHEFERPRPPPVPGKIPEPVPTAPPVPGKYVDAAASPRPSTPSAETDGMADFNFKPSAYLENGTPLRTVFLPNNLRHHFLDAAADNTRRNLETCGILCGILKSNALFITRLLIPEQTSTSDTCETVNEQEYFDYCDREDLMVLGWIHTHPTQTCFMSSRDLHTHVGYQVMMEESIAIVCAPSKEPSWGVFRLTDPPGKQVILNCTQPGIFHPHPVDDIYTEALKPGHVVELANAPLEVVDMRPRK